MYNELKYCYQRNAYFKAGTVGTESSKGKLTVKQVFDDVFKNVTVGTTLNNRIISYCKEIFSRATNVEWMGSSLFGVHPIRFYTTDRDRLFDEILQVDEDYLNNQLHKTDMNMTWIVTSDSWNLAVAYMAHKYYPHIQKDAKAKEAIVELLSLQQFKYHSSWYSQYFSKLVDMPAAEGAYAKLSLKFTIKRLGSWGALLRDRSESYVAKDTPHVIGLTKFAPTDKVVYLISDLNTRTRKTIKDYYAVLDDVRRNNYRINTQSNTVEIDGESILRDKVSAYNTSRDYLLDMATNPSSFYKVELTRVVLEMVPTASPNALHTLLMYIAALPQGKERKDIESAMEDTLLHAFDYIVNNRIRFTDVAELLVKLRALYMSSKTSDERVLSLRKRLEDFAKKRSHLRHGAALSAMRNALLMYFILRALAINNYK